jgi:thiol-disulfide isomerase/thioredoxin
VTSRLGLTRVELIATVALLIAVASVGVLLLRPVGSAGRVGDTGEPIISFDAVSLAPARAGAALPACPDGRRPPPAGPLAAVRLPCLGAPGVVNPAAGFAGKDALINLWATDCAPCRAELPALSAYATRRGAIPVLAVDQRDQPERALALLSDLKVKLPVVADPVGAVPAALHSPPALPLSYLLRADGSVSPVWPPVPFASADDVAVAVARLRGAPHPGTASPVPAGASVPSPSPSAPAGS